MLFSVPDAKNNMLLIIRIIFFKDPSPLVFDAITTTFTPPGDGNSAGRMSVPISNFTSETDCDV